MIVCLYVNDMILTVNNCGMFNEFKKVMINEFEKVMINESEMTDIVKCHTLLE